MEKWIITISVTRNLPQSKNFTVSAQLNPIKHNTMKLVRASMFSPLLCVSLRNKKNLYSTGKQTQSPQSVFESDDLSVRPADVPSTALSTKLNNNDIYLNLMENCKIKLIIFVEHHDINSINYTFSWRRRKSYHLSSGTVSYERQRVFKRFLACSPPDGEPVRNLTPS